MSAPKAEVRKLARVGQSKFWVGLCLVVLIGLYAFNLFILLFVVPKFEQIFADALPGKPLPPITNIILNYRILLAIATLAWPILGIFLWGWQKPYAIIWIILGLVWFLVEIGSTIIALLLPMVGTN